MENKISAFLNQSEARHRNIKQLKKSVLKHPFLSISFGLYWMQTVLLFQSPYLFLEPSPFEGSGFPKGTILLVVSVATYLFWAVLFRKINHISMQKWFPFVLATGLSCGALCFAIYPFFVSFNTEVAMIFYLVGSILIGCGMANVCLETGRIFGYLGPQQVLHHGICALCMGTVGAFMLSLFPPIIGKFSLVVMPIFMVACLWKSFSSVPCNALYGQGLKTEIQIPKKFLFTSVFQGLALGVMNGLLINNFGNSASIVTVGYMIAVFLLFFCAIALKSDFDFLIYRIGFPLMAAGFFLFGISVRLYFPGAVFLDIGYCFQYLVICSLCAYLAKGLGQPPIWIIGTGTACLLAGQFLGIVLQLAVPDQTVLVLSVSFILLIAALFMTSSLNLRYGWGVIRPGSDGKTSESGTDTLTIQLLASEHGLSKRETEVFALMVKGLSRKAIGKELCLAEETIKTHAGSIYQKCLVHSKQELIDMTKERAASLEN